MILKQKNGQIQGWVANPTNELQHIISLLFKAYINSYRNLVSPQEFGLQLYKSDISSMSNSLEFQLFQVLSTSLYPKPTENKLFQSCLLRDFLSEH